MPPIVVIGAGHNGLVAATMLARAGREVVVLEADAQPGGCLWTETSSDGYRFERGAVEHGGVTAVAEELGLARYGLRYVTRPTIGGAAFPDHVVSFEVDAARTADALGPDGPAYLGFAELAARLFALVDGFPAAPDLPELIAGLGALPGGDELVRLLLSSSESVLARRFDDPWLRSGLAMHGAHGQLPPWMPGTGLFSLLVPAAHGQDPARPLGGSGALIAALVAALTEAGGELRTGAPVTAIEPSGTGAVVRTGDGGRTEAELVVSSVDLPRTVELLTTPPAELARAARQVGSGRLNVAELKVDLALDRVAELGPMAHAPDGLWMLQDDPAALRRAFADLVAGRLPERLPVMLTVPSASDPTAAPEGGAVVWLSAFVPLRPAAGWSPELEEEAASRAVATVERCTGRRLDGVVERRITGPEAWAQRLRSSDGNPNHLDLTIDQMFGWRPSGTVPASAQTPWLYLTGAGTHPGGGVTGLPGRATARAILAGPGRRRGARSELGSLLAGWQLYRRLRRGV